jgi:phage baseplate assembly protein gpV
MLEFGIISEYDAAKGKARVKFDHQGIVSDWLPILVRGALDTIDEFPYDPDELVACLMDEHCEYGVILGAVNSDDFCPDAKDKNISQLKFKDGLIIQYDRSAKKYDLKLQNTELIMTESGFTIKRSSESLNKILSDLIDKILLLTVTTPVGVSGTPVNFADFQDIKQRLPNLFEN